MNASLLFAFATRSVLIALTGWLAVRCWRTAASGSREWLARGAFGLLLALPLAMQFGIPWLPIPATPPDFFPQLTESSATCGLLAGVWGLGAALLLAREVFAGLALHRIVRRADPLPDAEWRQACDEAAATLGLRGGIELRVGDFCSPAATGWRHLTVVLPRSCRSRSPALRSQILLHELAHFRRRDLWWVLAARSACAFHWFNPFAWALLRWLATERECACDAAVTAQGHRASDYAEALLALASSASRSPIFAPALPVLPPTACTLKTRIRRLLAPSRKTPVVNRTVEIAFTVLVFAFLAACSFTQSKPIAPSGWTADELRLRLTADPFPGGH